MPEAIEKRFKSVDDNLLTQFPKKPDYRNKWSTEHWRESPFDPKFKQYLKFALSSYDAKKEEKIVKHFSDIRSALDRKGTFYSFFKYDHQDFPANIDFFIIDLENNKLYIINHNT